MKKFDVKKFIKTLVILVIVAAIGVGGYFAYKHFTTTSDVPDNGQEVVGANITANPEHFDVWNGETATSFAKGTGTQKDPYQISTGAELAYFASLINNADETYKQAYYCLVNSIDLNGQEWTQIGYSSYGSNSGINKHFSDVHCFSGVFEGKGCVIKNFKITSTNKQMVGFFGDLNGGTIQNLGLENFTFSASNNTTKVYYVGGIVGYNRNGGKVSNCYTASDVRFTATTDDVYVGGIVGCNSTDSTIEYCYSIGNVSAIYRAKSSYGYSNTASANAGGIAAINSGNITNCYAKGNISAYADDGDFIRAGGIVAMNSSVGSSTTSYKYGKVTNCYAIGNISGTGVGQTYVGGLMGANLSSADVENCFATGDVYANGGSKYYVCAGGLLGISDTTKIINCYRLDGQKVVAVGANEEYCTLGTTTSLSNIKTASFQSGLNFSSCWTTNDGRYPDLKTLPATSTITYGDTKRTFINNTSFELSTASASGYTFNGWKIGDNFITDSEGKKLDSWALSGDVTANADFTAIEYTAEFYANDVLVDSVTFTVESDSLNEPTVPSVLGYAGKWESYSIIADNIRVDAVYDIETYTIEYICDESFNHGNATQYNVNSETFTLNELSMTGYTFNGWYDSNGNRITEIAKGSTGNLVLTAQFTLNEYTISFDSKGGNNVNSITQGYNTAVSAPNNPLRAGYDFEGWYIKDTNDLYEFGTMPAYNVELYAKWSDANVFDIIYELDNGENHAGNPSSYTVEDEIVLGDATKLGYSFDGWYLESTYTTKVESISKGNVGDKTLYAKFTIKQYTISFEVNDGSAIAPIVQDYNTTVTAPPKPTKENWSFAGWYADSSFNTEYVFGNMPAENTTVYVKWIPYDVYDIEYNHSILGVSEFETITADTFEATCVDTDGNVIAITVQIVGKQESGQTISVVLTAKANDITSKTTITNVKVYGNPELTFNNALTYFNYDDGVNAEWANASGIDTYGEATEIKVYVENEYKAGDVVTVIIEAVDCTGNITYGCLENIKVYGDPAISVENRVEQIKNTDTVTIDMFVPSTTDSFGVPLDVSMSWTPNANDISSFVNGEAVSYYTSATSSKIVEFIALNTERYTLYYQGAYTYISVYCVDTASYVYSNTYTSSTSLRNISFNVVAGNTYQIETYAYSAERCTDFTMYLVSASSTIDSTVFSIENMVGKSILVTFTSTDAYGNVGTLTIPVKVYGTPTINEADKTDLKITDEASIETLGLTAVDSFGGKISNITISLKDGEKIAGQSMVYTVTATDALGNTVSRDITVKIYGTPSLTIDRNGIKEDEEITIDSFNVTAKDSFGDNVIVNFELISGEQKAGTTMEYELEAIDNAGNVFTKRISVGVYSVDDISLNITNSTVTSIKVSSNGSEFGATAKDSFGQTCDFYIEAVNGILVAGQTMDIRLVAVDKAGNKVTSDIIGNVKIYDTPKITLMQNSYVIAADANIEFLFTVHDSFGNELVFEAIADKPLVSGEYVNVSVTATDIVGNTINRTYTFAVVESSKLSVNLYHNGALIDHAFLDSGSNYKLTIPTIEKFDEFYGWVDAEGNYYTDEYGNGIVEITADIELFSKTKMDNFTYICDATQLKSMELNKNYVLACNIDLGGENWTPLGTADAPFTGILYGNGYSISNFKLSGNYTYLGFMGYNAGEISNIKFSDASITSNQNNSYLGVVAAYNTGTIQDCDVTGTINLTRYNTYVGGLVGLNAENAIISNVQCNVSLTTTIPSSSSSSTMLGGTSRIGGIAGANSGTICDSKVTSNLTGDFRCRVGSSQFTYYSVTLYVGGVVGYSSSTEYNIESDCSILIDGYGPYAYYYVGGAVGYKNGGTINNVHTKGSIAGKIYANSSYGGVCRAGGIIGYNTSSSVDLCVSSCDLDVHASTSSSGYPPYCMAGGLVGYNETGKVSNSYSTGVVKGTTSNAPSYAYCGGLVGQNGGTIANCYSSGDVVSEVSGYNYAYTIYVGGAVGYNTGKVSDCVVLGDCKVITSSYYSSNKGSYSVSAVCGYNKSGTLTKLYHIDTQTRTIEYGDTTKTSNAGNYSVMVTEETLKISSFYTDILNWDIEIWDFSSNELPVLK